MKTIMTIMTIIRSSEAVPNACYSMLFNSVGEAMRYADETCDCCEVVVTGSDDTVTRRVAGLWLPDDPEDDTDRSSTAELVDGPAEPLATDAWLAERLAARD